MEIAEKINIGPDTSGYITMCVALFSDPLMLVSSYFLKY